MSTWTLNVVGAVGKNDVATGVAADGAAAALNAVDALASALQRHAGLGQRRYTVGVDDTVMAILVTGRDHQGSSPECLEALLRTLRDVALTR